MITWGDCMNYHRYFITLTPDSKGFEWGGKEPLGRCLLEDRGKSGKLSLWVQDLKAEVPYKIVLILSEMGKFTGAALGSLYVDGKGKGEFRNEFDSQSLADGQGLPRVCAVAVLAGSSGELLCPLVGYKDGPILWKNHFTMLNSDDKGHKNKHRAETIHEIQVLETPAAVEAVPAAEPVKAEAKESADTDIAADTEEEQGAPVNADEAPEEKDSADITEHADEYGINDDTFQFFENDSDPNAYGGKEGFYESPLDHIRNDAAYSPAEDTMGHTEQEVIDYDALSNLEEVFNNNVEITPFETKLPGEKWVRVSLREPVYLPVDYRFLMNHPFIIAAYKKYNHLVMGYVFDEGKKQFLLGVPGVYEPQYISTVRQLGFTQFKTVSDSKELQPNEYGYWLTPLYLQS